MLSLLTRSLGVVGCLVDAARVSVTFAISKRIKKKKKVLVFSLKARSASVTVLIMNIRITFKKRGFLEQFAPGQPNTNHSPSIISILLGNNTGELKGRYIELSVIAVSASLVTAFHFTHLIQRQIPKSVAQNGTALHTVHKLT